MSNLVIPPFKAPLSSFDKLPPIDELNLEELTLEELLESSEGMDKIKSEMDKIRTDMGKLDIKIDKTIRDKYLSIFGQSEDIYYDNCRILELEENDIDQLEYIGGYPSLTPSEIWPVSRNGKALTFVAQFIYNADILYRIFVDLDDNSDYYRCMPIKNNVAFSENISEIYKEITPLKKYNIVGYTQCKILKSYKEVNRHISISKEFYDYVTLISPYHNMIIDFPKKIPMIEELDQLPLFKINEYKLGKSYSGVIYEFFHQEKLIRRKI